MQHLEGKVALVTGAAGKMGQGRAIACRLARDGADVAINDFSQFGIHHSEDDRIEDWQGLKSVEEEIKALGRKALIVEADIGSKKQVQEMVTKCIDTFGKIDILVNNAAAVTDPVLIFDTLEVSDENWERVIGVNIFGTFWCCKAVANHMIERGQGGKIINTASEGVIGAISSGWGCYLVSKYGVLGITQVLAKELAQYKINVNAICPGVTASEMGGPSSTYMRQDMRAGMSWEQAAKKHHADLLPTIPWGRTGLPEDMAKVVAFLASGDSDYLTGNVIAVAGGHHMTY